MRSNKKYVIGILCWFLTVFGFLLGITSMMLQHSSTVHISHSEKPLRDVETVEVDVNGNLYYHVQAYGSVQVYDNQGEFLYRVVFPSIATWWLDNEGQLHLITGKSPPYSYYVVAEGAFVVQESLNALTTENMLAAQGLETLEMKLRETQVTDRNGFSYEINPNTFDVTVTDENGAVLAEVSPKKGGFIGSFGFYFSLMALGFGGFLYFTGIWDIYRNLRWWGSKAIRELLRGEPK